MGNPRRPVFSLRQLFVLLLTLCLLLPMLLAGSFFYAVISTQLEREVEINTGFYVEQMTRELDDYLDSVQNISLMLLATPEISDVLTSPPTSATYTEMRPVEDMLTRALLYNSAWDSKFLVSALIFSDSQPGTYVTALRESFYSASIERTRRVYEAHRDARSTGELVAGDNGTGYLYWLQNFDDIRTMRRTGKIVLEINPDRLFPAGENALQNIYPNAQTYLLNADRSIFFGSPGHTLGEPLRELPLPDAPGYLDLDGDSYYCVTRPLRAFSLQAVVLIPRGDLFGSLVRALSLFGVFCAVLLTGITVAGIRIFRLVHAPVQSFVGGVAAFGGGDLATRLPHYPVRELNVLSDSFNDMAERIGQLVGEVYEKRTLLRESELQLLQSQIDPHFIFNVLQLVNWKAAELHADEIHEIVTTLAGLIRSGVTLRGKEKITLREELYYVSGYLALQRKRYQDRLDFRIEVESERLRDCLVPKLMLQPIVENSIVHGLEPKRGPGAVSIAVWEEIDALFCRVRDDGVGFDPPADLLSAPPDDDGSVHNHIALRNIERRIQLLYGGSYGLTVHSRPGGGTEVLLRIPLDEGEG